MSDLALPVSRPARSTHRFHVARRVLADRTFLVCASFVALVALAAIFAPLLAAHSPLEQDLRARLEGPSGDHWLGTDALGRDIFARVLYGGRITFLAALQAVAIGAALGIPLGLVSGYTRGWLDASASTVSDSIMSMPPLLFALAIVGIRGPGLTNAMLAVGVILAPRFFRVSRAAANRIRTETYIEASKSLGCSTPRLLFRHVLPNAAGPLLVQTSFSLSVAIVTEASLSFLGLGVQPPDASWGSMTNDAFNTVREGTWPLYPPTIAIALVTLAVSLIGDSVRDSVGRQSRPKS